MRNILSYQYGTAFSGAEILNWAQYQVENRTSHFRQGKRILKLYKKTLKANQKYIEFPSYESWGCYSRIYNPLVVRTEKAVPGGKVIY